MGVAFATILRPLAAVKHKYKKKKTKKKPQLSGTTQRTVSQLCSEIHLSTHTRKNMHGTLHVDFLLN